MTRSLPSMQGGVHAAHPLDACTGLSEAEARRRMEAGLANTQARRTTRSISEIFRANLFTRFNAILGSLLVVILVVGPIQDALFGVVLVANVVIGVTQEWRAKRVLDRLAVVVAPQTTVIRDGRARTIAIGDVVLGDVIELRPGDQVVADGVVVGASGFEVDESLVSGEAEPVVKDIGSAVLSGSFVTAGVAACEATSVGASAYARQLAEEARRFQLVHSELRAGIDRILRLITWLLVPVAMLLVATQVMTHASLSGSVRASVAGVGAMIPEGLVLLTSIAFAVAAIRLSRRNVLVQELASVEGLARVDVLCIDKTGTITEPDLDVAEIDVISEAPEALELARNVLGALAANDPAPNRTLRAIARACEPPGWASESGVPFSSDRKWGGATFPGVGSFALGAPEAVLAPEHAATRARADATAAAGHRVVALTRLISDRPCGGGR